jgi:hypothetical protein
MVLRSPIAQHDGAEQVYRELLDRTRHQRAVKSLELLWATLHKMREDDVPDYSIARVGKYSEDTGGPRAQSIRNQNGAHFRELIDAFARTDGKSRQKSPAQPPSNVERAIDLIPDMAARVALKMMMEDRRRLQVETNELRTAFKRLSVATTVPDRKTDLIGQAAVTPINDQPNLGTLDATAIGAIERFLSPDWIDERLWSVEPDGSISDDAIGGDMIAPPGFVDALRDVVRHHCGET